VTSNEGTVHGHAVLKSMRLRSHVKLQAALLACEDAGNNGQVCACMDTPAEGSECGFMQGAWFLLTMRIM